MDEQYHRYLCSREWSVLKRAVKDRCRGICERCKVNTMTQVHHLTYIRKFRERLEDLQGLCRACHEFISGKSDFDPVYKPSSVHENPVQTEEFTSDEEEFLTTDDKLELLYDYVRECRKCTEICEGRNRPAFGIGPVGTELCFVGEAPGEDEDRQGNPFVGPSGQILNQMISACGFKREEVYLMNILQCRPPRNRVPLHKEIENCRVYWEAQLALVKPRFICALGSTAATTLLQTNQSIGKLRGILHYYRQIPLVATYHPAYLLPHRSPEKKEAVWDDMKFLLSRMGRPLPMVN